jgi:cytochrome c-type biogenesis protein CcmH/NrfF
MNTQEMLYTILYYLPIVILVIGAIAEWKRKKRLEAHQYLWANPEEMV